MAVPAAHSRPTLAGPLRGRRVLVWGGCGFIGRHLVCRLLAEGARVAVLSGPARAGVHPPSWRHAVGWLTIDTRNPRWAVLNEAVAFAEIVYNLAGSTDAVHSNRAPLIHLDRSCRPQLMFLEACARRHSAPHVVFVSTRLVYAAGSPLPVTEDAPLDPRSIYATHKLCVEQYHRIAAARSQVSVTVLRASPVYGYDEAHLVEPHGIVDAFLKCSLRGEPITVFGPGSQLRDFIYIDDFVDALVAAATVPAARNAIFNVGGGTSVTLREAAETIRAMTGGPAVRHEPWPEQYAAVESGDYIADITKARSLLAISPSHRFASGVERTLALARDASPSIASPMSYCEPRNVTAGPGAPSSTSPDPDCPQV